MKKMIAALFSTLILLHTSISACTTFFLQKNGQKVFGKNYDWMTGTGVIHSNLRGINKTSLPLDGSKPFQWKSKFGSITFNQYGKEFPNGGMNESGLVVELMWLSDSEYPKPDERPSISVLQWIQYQLDNCSTVDEVIATDKKMRIVSTGTPQHYVVADAKGNVATIEFLKGKLVVHKGAGLPFPVLANDTYQASLGAMKTSNDRFARACKMVQQYERAATDKPLVPYSFNILKNVAQGSFTKWSIVYDISNKQVFVSTDKAAAVKHVKLYSFDFASTATALAMDINTTATGDVRAKFSSFSSAENKRMLNKAFDESKERVEVPARLKDAMVLIAAMAKS